MLTPQGEFDCTVYRDRTGGLHLALTRGRWSASDEVLVRVHEPLSVLDLLDAGPCDHSWPLPRALAALQKSERGVGGAAQLRRGRRDPAAARCWRAAAARAGRRSRWTCAPTASARRSCATSASRRMKLLGSPRRMPSMAGYGLEVTGFVADEPPVVAPPPADACATLTAARPRASTVATCTSASSRRASTPSSPTGSPRACKVELAALGVAADRHRPGAACRARSRSASPSHALADERRVRRADRDRLRHPRRDLSLRAGRQRERRRR